MTVTPVPLHDPSVYEEGVPHDFFRRLRRSSPVYWQPEDPPGRGFWAVTRHADVMAVSRDTQTFSSFVGPTSIEDFCLGAPLGRIELRILFRRLIERTPNIGIAAPPRRLRSNFVSGIKELRVSL